MREFSLAVEDVGEMIRATAVFPGVPAERVLAAFTVPAELEKWWGGGALSTELVAGGEYTVKFAAIGMTMAGRIVRYAPPSDLEITWRWEHAPDAPARTAALSLRPAGAGSADAGCADFQGATLLIVHGPFGTSDAEAADRAGVREGWEHFLPRLAASLVP